jgi:Undecaprenyl-phosphate glucose phosphotransferase
MKTRETEQTFLNLFLDLLILNACIPFAAWILPGSFQPVSSYVLLGNLSWLLSYLLFGRHTIYLTDNFWRRFLRLTRGVLIFGVLSLALGSFLLSEVFSVRFILTYVVVFYSAKFLFSYSLYKFLLFKRRKGLNTKRALIVGRNNTGILLRKLIESNPILGYQFAGFVSRGNELPKDTLGRAEELERLIAENNIQKVFVTISLFSNGEPLREYLDICNRNGVRLRFVYEDQHLFHSGNLLKGMENLVMINPQELPLDRLGNRVLKRLFDIVFSLLVVVGIFSWLFPVLALLIKMSSRGPVFFMQKRTGLNNKTFNCFKFRSMRCNAVADIKQATENDDRITKIGHFMRKYYIDEIPQFLNVLWGDMSVVGPRPHMLKHTEIYARLIKDYQVRHFYKPGVTGWAQASGYCGETEELWKMQKRIEYDIEYNESWTFGLDLKIIWLTVFGRKAAARILENPDLKIENIHKEANRRLYEPIAYFLKKAVL